MSDVRVPRTSGFETLPIDNTEKLTPPEKGKLPATVGTALEVRDFGDDAGAGSEDLGLGEVLTPFLRMLQGLNPELNPSKAEHIPGAVLGQIINTATKELYGTVDAVICSRSYHYGLWIPRDTGGGFRGALPPSDKLVRDTLARMNAKYGSSGKFKMPRYRDGRWTDDPPRTADTDEAVEMVETGQYYLLYDTAGELSAATAKRAIIAFTSTALPVYQGVNTRHASWTWQQPDGQRRPAPLWAYRWRVGSRPDKNNKGEFFVWNFTLAPPAETYREALIERDDPIYTMGREFYDLVQSGTVKPDYDAPAADADDKDIPF